MSRFLISFNGHRKVDFKLVFCQKQLLSHRRMRKNLMQLQLLFSIRNRTVQVTTHVEKVFKYGVFQSYGVFISVCWSNTNWGGGSQWSPWPPRSWHHSKRYVVSSNQPKTNEIFVWISVLASKKRSNQKNKGTLYQVWQFVRT